MDKKNKDILGNHIISLIEKHNPYYFISIQYDFKDKDGNIDKERVKRLYDENLVKETHKHISNLLREAFENDLQMWWFIERNPSFMDDEGKMIRGYYHSHLILDFIQDRFIEEPSRALKKVLYNSNSALIPILNRVYLDNEDRKMDCIKEVIQQCDWCKTTGKSPVHIQEITNLKPLFYKEGENNSGYLMKQINDNEDLSTGIDFKNSSF